MKQAPSEKEPRERGCAALNSSCLFNHVREQVGHWAAEGTRASRSLVNLTGYNDFYE